MKKRMHHTAMVVLLAVLAGIASVNTEGQKGLVRTMSAKTYGQTTLDLGVGFNYAQDGGFMTDVIKGGFFKDKSYARMLSSTVNLGLGTANFLDIAASLPVFYDKTDVDGVEKDGGIGDLSISVKMLYPPPSKKRVFYQAYLLAGTIPTGTKEGGIFPRYTTYYESSDSVNYPMKGKFYANDCFTFKPMMLWTFDIGSVVKEFQFQILVNLGGLFSIDAERNNLVLANIALEYAPIEILSIFVDFAGQSRWQNFESGFSLGTDPLMLSPGLRLNTPAGLYISGAGDFALLSRKYTENWKPDHAPVDGWSYSTYVHPKIGFQLAVGWNGYLAPQDDDKDGIKNPEDRCPKDPEDRDGFEDTDGCPDPDNDRDGVDDSNDRCPNKAEDRDGYQDEDGCPDPDNDGDGILDAQDKCPNDPEDFDGIEDTDGCPDGDNDKDGVPDAVDKCPNEPEDIDGFQDNDGCPDPDNDKDGIPDLKDKCPNEPETMNGYQDEDGCPDEKPKVEARKSNMPMQQILEGVNFASGSTDLTFSSYQYLEPIIKEMKEFPEIEIEVKGHTDSMGKLETNMSLSQRRAESVKAHLVRNGIDPVRIRAVGYGPSSPIADNRTAAGRGMNRRIEVIRIK